MPNPIDLTGLPLQFDLTLSGNGGGGPAAPALEFAFTGGASLASFIYVVDSGNNRIEVFDHQGTFKFEWGTWGSGKGQFISPYGVCVTPDGSRVYVSDSGNARVQAFDKYGNFLFSFGSVGTYPGKFQNPMGIATDGMFIYVVDSGNNRFQIFSLDGYFIMSVGTFGSGNNQFNAPTKIAVDDLYIYIDDTGNSRIVIYGKGLVPESYIIADMPAMQSEIACSVGQDKIVSELPAFTSTILSVVNPSSTINAELPAFESEVSTSIETFTIVDAALPSMASEIGTVRTTLIVIDASLPAMQSEIYGTQTLIAEIVAEFPSIISEILSSVSANTLLKTVVMNTLTKGVSEYEDFGFNSYALFDGKYLGADGVGIFELTGETDNGTAIDAEYMTGDVDFNKQTVEFRPFDTYIHLKSPGDIILLLQGEQDNTTLSEREIPGSGHSLLFSWREKFGKNLDWRVVRAGMKNKNGADFEVREMVLDGVPVGKQK